MTDAHRLPPATLDVLLAVDHAAARGRQTVIRDAQTPDLVEAVRQGLVLVHGSRRYSLSSEGRAQLRRASFRLVKPTVVHHEDGSVTIQTKGRREIPPRLPH